MKTLTIALLMVWSLTPGMPGEAETQQRARRTLATSDGRPLVAYLIARAGDCESHYELLRHLQRPSIARTTRTGGALLVGSRTAVRESAARLHRELPSVAARRMSVLERRLLWRIGYRSTPMLVVFDVSSGHVRFAAPAPLTIDRRLQVIRALGAATRM